MPQRLAADQHGSLVQLLPRFIFSASINLALITPPGAAVHPVIGMSLYRPWQSLVDCRSVLLTIAVDVSGNYDRHTFSPLSWRCIVIQFNDSKFLAFALIIALNAPVRSFRCTNHSSGNKHVRSISRRFVTLGARCPPDSAVLRLTCVLGTRSAPVPCSSSLSPTEFPVHRCSSLKKMFVLHLSPWLRFQFLTVSCHGLKYSSSGTLQLPKLLRAAPSTPLKAPDPLLAPATIAYCASQRRTPDGYPLMYFDKNTVCFSSSP